MEVDVSLVLAVGKTLIWLFVLPAFGVDVVTGTGTGVLGIMLVICYTIITVYYNIEDAISGMWIQLILTWLLLYY
jgi:hypothetical protein